MRIARMWKVAVVVVPVGFVGIAATTPAEAQCARTCSQQGSVASCTSCVLGVNPIGNARAKAWCQTWQPKCSGARVKGYTKRNR